MKRESNRQCCQCCQIEQEVEVDAWLLTNVEGSLDHQLYAQLPHALAELTASCVRTFGQRRGMDIDHAISDSLDTYIPAMQVRLDSIFNFEFNAIEEPLAFQCLLADTTLGSDLRIRLYRSFGELRGPVRLFHIAVTSHFSRED